MPLLAPKPNRKAFNTNKKHKLKFAHSSSSEGLKRNFSMLFLQKRKKEKKDHMKEECCKYSAWLEKQVKVCGIPLTMVCSQSS